MSLALLHETLQRETRHASPFFVLGDPTPELSLDLIDCCVEEGATMLELGLAYDDPCADGPAIQAAAKRARAAGMTTSRAFELLNELRKRHPKLPLNLLVYGNLVHARGYARFCKDAATAGASSLLVPDIPLEEGDELRRACRDQGIGIVQLAAPLTSNDRLRALEDNSDAFVYLAAFQGVTGADAARHERRQVLERVRRKLSSPLCLGFGLRDTRDLADAFDAGAQIAVVGSALARVIGEALAQAADDASTITMLRNAWRPALRGPRSIPRNSGVPRRLPIDPRGRLEMLVIMHAQSTREQCVQVEETIRRMGCTPLEVPGANRIAICVTGNRGPVDESLLARLPGVLECIRVTKPYKLVSREVRSEATLVKVKAPGGQAVTIGSEKQRPDRRTVQRRDGSAHAQRRAGRPERRSRDLSRRGVQAPHEPLRLPGSRRGGPRNARPRAA